MFGLKDPNIVLYLDGNNVFIREFVTHYNSIQNSDSKDIGQIIQTLSYIQGIIINYENNFKREKLFFNLIFEKGRSSQHINLDDRYKQNRDNKFLGLDLGADDKELLDKKETFKYNLDQIRDIFRSSQKKLNYLQVYYTEGDFQVRYLMEKYQKYFDERKEEVIHIIFSTDSDFRQLLSDKFKMNVVLYDIIKKRLQTMFNYKEIYSLPDELNQDYFLFQKIVSGDKSDNIKGIRGCGIKTQQVLFQTIKESFDPNNSQEELVSNLLGFINNKDSKISKVENLLLIESETLIKNYKMTNLIRTDNVIDMINMSQISEINLNFNNYISYRNSSDYKNPLIRMKLLMALQKEKVFSFYKIIDHIDLVKFLKQIQ